MFAVMSDLMAGDSWKSEKHSFQVLSSAFVFVEKYPFASRIPTRISDLRNKILFGWSKNFEKWNHGIDMGFNGDFILILESWKRVLRFSRESF